MQPPDLPNVTFEPAWWLASVDTTDAPSGVRWLRISIWNNVLALTVHVSGVMPGVDEVTTLQTRTCSLEHACLAGRMIAARVLRDGFTFNVDDVFPAKEASDAAHA